MCRLAALFLIVPAIVSGANLLLVTIDTLRPDHLGCYGYRRAKTPNVDAVARAGVVFENAVTPTPLTAPSHASIFTGLYPTAHKVRDTGGFILDSSHPMLAGILGGAGWDTAAFVGSSVLRRQFGFAQGFAAYDDEMPKPEAAKKSAEFAERRAGEVVDRAIAWLGRQPARPFFLWVHVFDPHSPYDPPAAFRDRYPGNLYDGEIAYTDQELGRLFATVASRRDKTIIAVLSDHGESFAGHGEYTHGVFLYDSTVRVAFLLSGPGVPAGKRVKQQVRTIDVLPTVLELLGVKAPGGLQGRSLLAGMGGKGTPSWSYEETLYPKINMGWAELRGVRSDKWKYIRAPRPELYDLVRDPNETSNVASSHPYEVRQSEALLRSITGTGQEIAATTLLDSRTLAQLKSLGYLGGSSAHEYVLAGAGADPKDRLEVLKLLYLAVSPDAGTARTQRVPLLRQALALDPGNPSLYYHLGDEYAQSGRPAEALKLYQDALRNHLDNAWIFSRMGHLNLQQGNKDQAIAWFERAAQMNPSDSESLADLGMVYLETGQLAGAEKAFKWSIAVDDRYPPALNGLGLVFIQKRELASARDYFEQAVRLDPDLLEAQLNLGRIYRIMGSMDKARACFEAFLARAKAEEYGPIIAKVREELAGMR
jgi:arylsulfatase A-like enzyme/Flp pilus assembly protein TadD